MITKACCITGHRDIPADKVELVKTKLREEIEAAMDEQFQQTAVLRLSHPAFDRGGSTDPYTLGDGWKPRLIPMGVSPGWNPLLRRNQSLSCW